METEEMKLTHGQLVSYIQAEEKSDRKVNVYQRAKAYFNMLGYMIARERCCIYHLLNYRKMLKDQASSEQRDKLMMELDETLVQMLDTVPVESQIVSQSPVPGTERPLTDEETHKEHMEVG